MFFFIFAQELFKVTMYKNGNLHNKKRIFFHRQFFLESCFRIICININFQLYYIIFTKWVIQHCCAVSIGHFSLSRHVRKYYFDRMSLDHPMALHHKYNATKKNTILKKKSYFFPTICLSVDNRKQRWYLSYMLLENQGLLNGSFFFQHISH